MDYANVFASLERALAIYGKGSGGEMPVRDKKALVEELRKAVANANVYCAAHGVDLATIEATPAARFERAQAVEDAANRLLAPEAVKREFLAQGAAGRRACSRAVKPDPVAIEFSVALRMPQGACGLHPQSHRSARYLARHAGHPGVARSARSARSRSRLQEQGSG